LKHRFRVGSYKEADDSRFDELMTYLREELSRVTADEAPEQGSLFYGVIDEKDIEVR
jgi:hypothetical protein